MARFYNLTDPETIHVWDNIMDREVRARDPLLDPDAGLSGEKDSLVCVKDNLSTGPGAYITVKYKYQISGRGRGGDEVLKGNEERYQTATDNIYVDVLRHAFKSDSPMTQQFVKEDVMDEGVDSLSDWAATRMSMSLHAHAAGIALITDPVYRLHNTISAINSTYIFRPNGKTAGNLTAGDVFDVDLINDVAQFVKTVRPKLRPAKTPWGPRFCVFLHPDQVKDLKNSNSLWFAEMQSAMEGGRIDDNPIFTTALGQFNGFVFFESDFVPPGLNSGETAFKDNTRRAWIGGAGALGLAFGRGDRAPGFSLNRWQWVRESEDFGFSNAVAAMTIVGAKRYRFTRPGEGSAREAGIVVVETYAEKATSLTSDDVYADWIAASGASVEA